MNSPEMLIKYYPPLIPNSLHETVFSWLLLSKRAIKKYIHKCTEISVAFYPWKNSAGGIDELKSRYCVQRVIEIIVLITVPPLYLLYLPFASFLVTKIPIFQCTRWFKLDSPRLKSVREARIALNFIVESNKLRCCVAFYRDYGSTAVGKWNS